MKMPFPLVSGMLSWMAFPVVSERCVEWVLDGIPSGFGTLCWVAFPLVSECCSECHSLWFQNSVLDARTAGALELRDV